MDINFKDWSKNNKIKGVSALIAILGLCLPWYKISLYEIIKNLFFVSNIYIFFATVLLIVPLVPVVFNNIPEDIKNF